MSLSANFKLFVCNLGNTFHSYGHGYKINIFFNSSGSSVQILITLITVEEGSEQLLKEVEKELGKLILGFDAIAQTATVKRFG